MKLKAVDFLIKDRPRSEVWYQTTDFIETKDWSLVYEKVIQMNVLIVDNQVLNIISEELSNND